MLWPWDEGTCTVWGLREWLVVVSCGNPLAAMCFGYLPDLPGPNFKHHKGARWIPFRFRVWGTFR